MAEPSSHRLGSRSEVCGVDDSDEDVDSEGDGGALSSLKSSFIPRASMSTETGHIRNNDYVTFQPYTLLYVAKRESRDLVGVRA